MKVKFYLNPFYLTDNYCPEAVQLADGFRALGWSVVGNINYWKRGDGFLIPKEDVQSEVDLVIMDHRFVHHTKSWVIQEHVLSIREKGCARILLERQSGQENRPQWNREGWLGFFDLVLATHRTVSHPRHDKIVDWQIGVVQEVIDVADKLKSPMQDYSILCNFRIGHDVRGRLTREIEESMQARSGLNFVQAIDVADENSEEAVLALNAACL